MSKGKFFVFVLIFLVLGINFVSAGYYWSYHDYNRDYSESYKKRLVVTDYDRQYKYERIVKTEVKYDWDDGKYKRTFVERVETKPLYYNNHYQYRSEPYYCYGIGCGYYRDMDKSYTEEYKSSGDRYDYYAPPYDYSGYGRYDSNLGYYNWRY